ncbi:hypothetical protein GCM10027169_27540 [Gordonia jinhuaensis]|uniref:RiboL-PSP-HEPN domain-containing protein n=1 Tax=Gordonia jinhuaensis TaxID=1517702 RepID=A0A916T9Y7_9ACTN|nr:hypothetical protein [Gordonia jinhuaensis]GGB37448.1 hypothetical protein GCM10011489_26590 [Gordonia jinhuaensis]
MGIPEHSQLATVIAAADEMAVRLCIPADMISLHRDLKVASMSGRTKKQHSLRWGAFLLTYAAAEGFFNGALGRALEQSRPMPLNPDKIRATAAERHSVNLFTKDWGVRTRTMSGERGNRSEWETFIGPEKVRLYLADMKSLRDILGHGGDPYRATNKSGALWTIQKGASLRLMGVEGFLQACCDLADQTILAYGGPLENGPTWPEPDRSALSNEDRPSLPLLS